ncbi:hypothetical protein P3T36_007341 [Kitasatospora sp. MAP12-15]|uniref:hypothetical protein n=1 Tax=unclassified Kitasatospora TaxID=2633591 RepID=UPI0024745AC5|nr:hypothetical protein [Kitasatospora sp. MAP12-44]MDH6115052.1 hypothetical protein [Kitasatospora sp. MAP12-44]
MHATNGDTPPQPHGLHSCPSCDLPDQVKGVPAVYLAGRDSITMPGGKDEDGRETTVTRTVTTALSAALAPAPPSPAPTFTGLRGLGVLALLVAVGTFIGGAVGGHWFSGSTATAPPSDAYGSTLTINGIPTYITAPTATAPAPHSDLAFLGWVSGLALLAAVLLFIIAARRGSAFRTALAGRPAAEQVWSRAWYCARCGSVHFPPTPGERPQALSLQEFRALVWQAGGYGHLVAKHPVV